MSETIRLHYHRPPDRAEVFEQELLYRDAQVIVTLNRSTSLSRPMVVNGATVFESGAPAIWFTFPGLMHDIGRFHTVGGRFTGLYANIIVPVEMHSANDWSATDLFLDVWIGEGERPLVLDQDEFEDAIASAWIEPGQAAAARRELEAILDACDEGSWPPAVVNEWTIERVSSGEQRQG